MGLKTLYIKELKREVSRLGLGSMVMSMDTIDLSFELLDAYVSYGGNLIDTAEIYASEAPIGEWVQARGNRADVVILDKGCHHPWKPLNQQTIPETITRCLDTLQMDYLDLFVFHRDNPEIPVEDIINILNDEVNSGRIRAFGGSNWSVARLAAANAYAEQNGLMGMAVSSPHVCLAAPKEPFWEDCTFATDEDLAWYAKVGMPVIGWSTQGRGFFLDSSGPDDTNEELIRVYHNQQNFERLARARKLAKQTGVETIQIALAYVLNLPAPTFALVGPETLGQLAMCVQAAQIELTQAEVEWLNLKRETL